MHARSTTIRGRPETVDDGIAFCHDEVLPMCRELPGCVGLSMIVDRGSGRCIATTSWDSIESMRATATQMQPIRQRAAEILGGTPEVAEWEIAVMHRDHRSADGACARVTWLRGDPAAMNRAADVFKLALMPEMETFDGFCGVSLMINRETGLAVTSVAFDSRAALEGTREQARGLRARGSAEARLEITGSCRVRAGTRPPRRARAGLTQPHGHSPMPLHGPTPGCGRFAPASGP